MGSYTPTPQPEILSPHQDPPPAPAPERKPRPSWSYAPATYVLTGINCLVFLVMCANHVSFTHPTGDQIMYWGANNAGSVLVAGQWWRIVTAMFEHVGILHIALNMWCLWNLGLLAEPLMGSVGVTALYILTGAAGNLLSVGYNWLKYSPGWMHYHALWLTYHTAGMAMNDPSTYFSAGAGASGAVFGFAGALIVLLKSPRLPVPPNELRKLRKSVIYFAGLNLGLDIVINLQVIAAHTGINIDNSAHLGGFLCGLLLAAPMVPRIGSPRPLFKQKLLLSVGIVTGILVLFAFYLVHLTG